MATPHLRNMGTLGGNLCLDTRCNYYNQNYEWRKAIDFCLKKDGDICWVATASKRCVAVSSTDTAPALIALERVRQARSRRRRARDPASRSSTRTTASTTCRARRTRSSPRCSVPRRAGRAPTGSCAAAARSISRSSASAAALKFDGRCRRGGADRARRRGVAAVPGREGRRVPQGQAAHRRSDRARRRAGRQSREADGQHRHGPLLAQGGRRRLRRATRCASCAATTCARRAGE